WKVNFEHQYSLSGGFCSYLEIANLYSNKIKRFVCFSWLPDLAFGIDMETGLLLSPMLEGQSLFLACKRNN
ncbi:hypothetical protein, partial [Vibrio caribbeanicus]|uniref:hypothetical protein n=1 Tax=Vibrio caribbeanicus TaxID=701175 RepID=UPI0022836FFE